MLKYNICLVVAALVISGCNPTAQVTQDRISFDNEEIPILSQEDKEYLINVSQTSVSDFFNGKEDAEHTWPASYDGINNTVFVAFRIQGKKKGSWSAKETNLAQSVYLATQRTLKDNRYDGAIKKKHVPELKIEIFILGKSYPFSKKYEPGIHGLRIRKDNRRATFYNDVVIEKKWTTKYAFKRLCRKAKLPENCYDDESVEKYIFRTLHFGTTTKSPDIVTFYKGR